MSPQWTHLALYCTLSHGWRGKSEEFTVVLWLWSVSGIEKFHWIEKSPLFGCQLFPSDNTVLRQSSWLQHPGRMQRNMQEEQILPRPIHSTSKGSRFPAPGSQEEAMSTEHQEVRGKEFQMSNSNLNWLWPFSVEFLPKWSPLMSLVWGKNHVLWSTRGYSWQWGQHKGCLFKASVGVV